MQPPAVRDVQQMLARFGYDVAPSGSLDEQTRLALAAFQRHFRPSRVDAEPDAETTVVLATVCACLD
jgi:N-acetylmuramoyl-L-alanine amidase